METKKVCACTICFEQLNKPTNGKLQIWYGTGNNGKTTLLNKLMDKHMNNVICISTRPSDFSYFATYSNANLIIIPSDGYKLSNDFMEIFTQKYDKNKKYIHATNILPQIDDKYKDYVDIIKFDHVFKSQ